MPQQHREMPETVPERVAVVLVWCAIMLGVDWLVDRIRGYPNLPHALEFIGLVLLAALAVYLIFLFVNLSSVSYTLADDTLCLEQGLSQIVIDLNSPFHLYRWRSRWGWSGGAARDLPVDEIIHVPPLGTLRRAAVWVVLGTTRTGVPCAVALRPSGELLALLRQRREEAEGTENRTEV